VTPSADRHLTTFGRDETVSMGRPVEMVIEFTGYERPRQIAEVAHMSSSTMDLQGTLTFEPVPEGTRRQWSWDPEPGGILKEVVSPLLVRMGRRQEQIMWTGLKHLLEERTN